MTTIFAQAARERVKAELAPDGKRIIVRFPYDPELVARMKTVSGRRWNPDDRVWTVPLELTTARRLREAFGSELVLGLALAQWGREQVSQERNLGGMAIAETAELVRLPVVLPELFEFISAADGPEHPARPFQLADIAFMAKTNAINANQPGMGKTIETIGAVWEAGIENGQHLVICPKTSIETVWQAELERWTDARVYAKAGGISTDLDAMADDLAAGRPFWLVTTANQLRGTKCKECDGLGRDEETAKTCAPCKGLGRLPGSLPEIPWKTITIDEYHKTGITNHKTAMAKMIKTAHAERVWLLSGTPLGGKAQKLWGALNTLHPKSFPSFWRWAENWLELTPGDYATEVGGIIPDRQEAFYSAHAPYMVRRLKSEHLKELPAKIPVHVWCDLTSKQAKQYKELEKRARVVAEDQRSIGVKGVLAEYTRMKQISNATHEIVTGGQLAPTHDSGKLPALLDRLAECGIRPERDGAEGDEVAIVGTQFKQFAYVVRDYLVKHGIAAELLTGDTKPAERKRIISAFQTGNGPRVVVLTTGAGGTSITLDRADSAHLLDETWNPDDQEQFEDRIHRASRIHQVTCYYYRSRGTIEEYIYEITDGKMEVNRTVLDKIRQRIAGNSR